MTKKRQECMNRGKLRTTQIMMAAVRYVAYGAELKLQAAWFLLNWITRLNEATNCVQSDRVNGFYQGVPYFQNITVSRNMLKWNVVCIRESITAFLTPTFKRHPHAKQCYVQISSPNSWIVWIEIHFHS